MCLDILLCNASHVEVALVSMIERSESSLEGFIFLHVLPISSIEEL